MANQNFLPLINYNTDWEASWSPEDEDQKQTGIYLVDDNNDPEIIKQSKGNMLDLYNAISYLVGADCWAVTINDEILFNCYDQEKPIRDRILDNLVRKQIVDEPHRSIFVHFFRSQTPVIVRIYMYGSNSAVYQIEFDPNQETFLVTSYLTY
jgi:hypothetical protein